MEKVAKRKELESSLIQFTNHFFQARGEQFIENWHHHKIEEALRQVETGEIKNLLINMPPRYGKTELAVVNWIAKCLAVNPKAKFIHLSYSDDLALDNSSKAKEMIQSDEYQKYWSIKLKDDSQSKKKWYTTEGGGLYATAAGGAITGFGAGSTSEEGFAGAIIIDDPLKVDDAERDGERDRVNERLNTTIKSRRNSRHTPIIIIMQRLHEEDMSGFVLDGKMGEEFYHLKLPAIHEDKPLWDFKHNMQELEAMRNADPRTFAGQYQQEPSPEDGEYFKREWFKRYDIGDEPELLTKYGAADYAVTEPKKNKDPDFTEMGVGGFDEIDDFWIVDWWKGQTTADKWIEEQFVLHERHEPFVWVSEAGVIKNATDPFISKEMRNKGIYFRMEWISSNKNKTANARAFQALASQGKVHIPNTPWGEELISQLLKFPDGKFDDGVDVCGLFGRILDQTYAPRKIQEEKKPERDGYEDDEDIENEWMMN